MHRIAKPICASPRKIPTVNGRKIIELFFDPYFSSFVPSDDVISSHFNDCVNALLSLIKKKHSLLVEDSVCALHVKAGYGKRYKILNKESTALVAKKTSQLYALSTTFVQDSLLQIANITSFPPAFPKIRL